MKYTIILSLLCSMAFGQTPPRLFNWNLYNSGEALVFDYEEYEVYKTLSPRNKSIVDSLKEAGIPIYTSKFLYDEVKYMPQATKIMKLYHVIGPRLTLMTYRLYRLKKSRGFTLLKETELK